MLDRTVTFLDLRSADAVTLKIAHQEHLNTIHHTPCQRDVFATGVRVTEKTDIHKSLNPPNEISQGQQKWSGRWGSFHSGRIGCGLYCFAQHTSVCSETATTCKSLKNSFFFSPPPPSDFTPRPWRMRLAQCATVLLNGPFLLPTL